jgi:hypothetical protein
VQIGCGNRCLFLGPHQLHLGAVPLLASEATIPRNSLPVLVGPSLAISQPLHLNPWGGCSDVPIACQPGPSLILYYTKTMLYYIILYYTMLYYTILYHTILYYTLAASRGRPPPAGCQPERANRFWSPAPGYNTIVCRACEILKAHVYIDVLVVACRSRARRLIQLVLVSQQIRIYSLAV